jgi:protein-S-isoprenylcysteine O-methyltransferase Ste14
MNHRVLFFIIVPPIAFAYIIVRFLPAHWSGIQIAGLILTVGGLVLLTVSRIQLGNSFSLRPEARKLITHGIYSRIRNPIYVFGLITIAGLFLYLNRPLLLLLILVIVPIQIARARAEGRVLEERFGDEYRQYRSSTWF